MQWARAQAIQAAYTEILNAQSPSRKSIPLSTADVYDWLVGNDHFIMRRPKQKRDEDQDIPANEPRQQEEEIWCAYCGQKKEISEYSAEGTTPVNPLAEGKLDMALRQSPDAITLATEGTSTPHCICPAPPAQLICMVKMPMVDVHTRLHLNPSNGNIEQNPFIISPSTSNPSFLKKYSNADIIQATHPHMTAGVYTIVSRLGLPAFQPERLGGSLFPVEQIGSSKSSREASLAPHAMLSIATQSFLRVLVKCGLEQCQQDANNGNYTAAGTRRKRKAALGDKGTFTSVLTPAHILKGIVARGQAVSGGGRAKREAERMVYEVLLRLGVGIESGAKGTILDHGNTDRGGSPIKTEEP
jgi:hypothetical protein